MFGQLKLVLLEERIVLDAAAAAVIYVNAHATGSVHNGDSWATAYTNLQSALTEAATENSHPVQIWIAQGTYTPSQIYTPTGFVGTPTANMDTFNLPNNVELIGGFAGNEKSILQANPSLHPTILSGLNTDWHVVTAIDVTASLNGLTVTGGYADGPDAVNNGSLVYSFDSGGGLYARFGSNITLNNDIFVNDSAANSTTPAPANFNPGGGAVYATDPGTQITIANSQFLNDSASTSQLSNGGALWINFGASSDITGSLFQGNSTNFQAGAVGIFDGGHLNISNSIFNSNTQVGGLDLGLSAAGGLGIGNTNATVTNTLFENNHSGLFGGGIAIQANATLPGGQSPYQETISNSVFINNSAALAGGGFTDVSVIDGINVTITGDTFINNQSGLGGAFDNDSGTVKISNSKFIDNQAQIGGALDVDGDVSSLLSAILQIPLPPGNVTVLNSSFIGNVSEDNPATHLLTSEYFEAFFGMDINFLSGGAAIDNHGNGILNVQGSTFIDNQSINGNGGAILNGDWNANPLSDPSLVLDNGAVTTVTNSSFVGNQATNGGAIATESVSGSPIGLTLAVSNSLFTNNSALTEGGAIYTSDAANLSVLNSTFLNNDTTFTANAPVGGGAIFDENTTASLTNDLFVGNSTAQLGGAVYFEGFFESSPHTYAIDNCVFLNNTGTIGGGAVNVAGILGSSASAVNIQDSTFIGNSADSGGGVLAVNLPVNIAGSLFQNNTAFVFGGAVCVNNLIAFGFGVPNNGDTTITNSTFINNTDVGSTAAFARLSVFLAQVFGLTGSAVFGGGAIVVHEDGLATISHNTFIGNTNQNGDGGAILVGGAVFQQLANLSVTGAFGGVATITNNSFIGNSASVSGGAIAAVSAVPRIPSGNPGSVTLTAQNNSFSGNQAASNGGALYLSQSNDTILQNTFYATNNAQNGDQIYATQSLVNGYNSSNLATRTALLDSLLDNNIFKLFESDDIVLN